MALTRSVVALLGQAALARCLVLDVANKRLISSAELACRSPLFAYQRYSSALVGS